MFVNPPNIEFIGFTLIQEWEDYGDCYKLWQTAFSPDGQRHTLDHSPYETIGRTTFMLYVRFYQENGRFPKRNDMCEVRNIDRNPCPFRSKDIFDLMKHRRAQRQAQRLKR